MMRAAGATSRLQGILTRISAREDVLSGAIAASAMVIFLGSATLAVSPVLNSTLSAGGGADRIAAVALFLNLALVLFAWARHREVKKQLRARLQAERECHLLRTRDLDTELLNRNSLRERGTVLVEAARQDRGNVALLVVSLDGLKKMNEIYGEAIGDSIVCAVAAIILNTSPRDALCARLRTDEFAIGIPFEDSAEEKITSYAEELSAQLNLPMEIMGAMIQLRAALGIASLGFGCLDFATLLRRADIAMNAAKAKKSTRPLWFDSRIERALCARNEVKVGLRRGIPLGEFVPYYQPIVEFSSGQIRGMEMLARWHHPAGGVVEPEIFIPIAEETGLIGDLCGALMRAAFEEAKHWDPSIMLSVNISPSQLTDPWLAHRILKLLTETGFPAARLEVEITESSMFENLEVAQAVVASLKKQGIRLSLDDFGTGYSSLSNIRALPFDRIKIDRSFVLKLNKDPESWTIVKTIASLGASLGVPVTVVGVESAAIELRVRDLGCDLGQGWFFGEPAAGPKTRLLLAEHGLCPPDRGEMGLGKLKFHSSTSSFAQRL
jgi:diguanylate cyclase (GGDEF)-like protein